MPAPDKGIFYFAYGSNMLLERLCAANRCPGAVQLCSAVAEDFELTFDKPSKDGSGKATIKSRPNSIVRGVVFQIPADQVSALDAAEGAGKGYERAENFPVSNEGKVIPTKTYIADRTIAGLRPYDWYLQLVVAGARQNHLPEDYIARLENIGSLSDPNSQRMTRLEALRALQLYNSPTL